MLAANAADLQMQGPRRYADDCSNPVLRRAAVRRYYQPGTAGGQFSAGDLRAPALVIALQRL